MITTKQKALILDWLSSLVGYVFPHQFSDQFIHVSIWNDQLSIGLDFRQPAQLDLFEKLPKELKGCLQYGTGKLVNEQNLYFKISEICSFIYPTINYSKLIRREKHQSGSGGWIDVGEYFYTYDWELTLSDGSTIFHHNQSEIMDLVEESVLFRTKIQEKEFFKFINSYDKS